MMAWQVHRFRDCVAVSTGSGGDTVYMPHDEAARMAKAINAAVRSIKRESFADSAGLTKSGEASREYPHGYACERR